ncbi:MAG: N-formylglutamate amidohydrolase [Polyangiaceae bacterium]
MSAPSEPGIAGSLLDPADPPPFRLFEERTASPFLLSADHAGRAIPRALGSLGLSQADLDRHIAWDIGIAGVTERLAASLGCFAILQSYSRLVIDCNRPPHVDSSIATLSEYTEIPGNLGLSAAQKAERQRAIFAPYHARLLAEFERREREQRPLIYVAMHSFTPRFKEVDREWQFGVLYNRDTRLALELLAVLRAEGFEVGDNQPYFVSDLSDYGVPTYGEQRGHVHVELEIRQDLIATPEAQGRIAGLLSHALPAAAKPFLG